jgi:hypothetical protein
MVITLERLFPLHGRNECETFELAFKVFKSSQVSSMRPSDYVLWGAERKRHGCKDQKSWVVNVQSHKRIKGAIQFIPFGFHTETCPLSLPVSVRLGLVA